MVRIGSSAKRGIGISLVSLPCGSISWELEIRCLCLFVWRETWGHCGVFGVEDKGCSEMGIINGDKVMRIEWNVNLQSEVEKAAYMKGARGVIPKSRACQPL